MQIQRIDKIIASQGQYSRKDVKKLIKLGKVKVNGEVVKTSEQKYDTHSSEFIVDGKKLEFQSYIYIMLNKPKGVVSASEDREHKTVVDLVYDEYRRDGLFPAGRLDGDTTGFVLITDDGDFAHKILSPKNHIMKTYHAELEHEISEDDIRQFRDGVQLKDGTLCLESKLKVLSDTQVEVQIHEGKYHQIKRMFAAIGNKVVELKRVKMGNLSLDESLGLGEYRLLSKSEVEAVASQS